MTVIETRPLDVEGFLNDLIQVLEVDEKQNNNYWRFHIVPLEHMRESGSSLHKVWITMGYLIGLFCPTNHN